MSAIAGFVNPFEVDGGLICLSSGQPVPDDLATNLVSVQHQGEQEFDNFGLPDTFGELALKVFACLPSASVVHFVTDRYDDLSIKDIERVRRGQDDCNTHTIRGPSTKNSPQLEGIFVQHS
ncbi:hypothetical protein ElyMa_002435500 [Elysia marginata]|uniref:Uncharacterized protein n=1 Tax=Elysia marginata TaxID=1093978 RepID=A0AAV4GI48_9GAST|nr:hypothetical protein ElyMa_002435500 [Elysia marginata]